MEIRPGEVPPDGGTAVQDDPDRLVFHGNGSRRLRLRLVRQPLATAMHPVQMTKKVRVRRRCSTVNVSVIDGYDVGPVLGSEQREQQRVLTTVGGFPVAVDGHDPNERRVTHSRSGEIAQRIVIGPPLLHAAESEALGRQAAIEPVGARAPGAAKVLVLLDGTRASRPRDRARGRPAGTR